MTFAPDHSAGSAPQTQPSSRRLSFTTVGVLLFVIAGGLGFLSHQLSLPWLMQPALLFTGMLFVMLGLGQIVSRLDAYRGVSTYVEAVEFYKALVIQLWGLIILGLGLMIDFRAILGFLNPAAANSMFNAIFNSTPVIGVVVAGVGLMTTLNGLVRLLAGRNDQDEARIAGARDALFRLEGAAVLLLGLAVSLAGSFIALAPDTFSGYVASLLGTLAGP